MKVIVWDYNGTILDDVKMSVDIENNMLKERGMRCDYSVEEYKDNFCFPVIDYYRMLGYDFTGESYEELSVVFNRLYDEHFAETKLMNGFPEKIRESIEKGYKNVIISACQHDKLLNQCRYFGIDSFFDSIQGIDNLLAGSKIDIALKWMKDAGVSGSDCIYIGDSVHDQQTADALGINRCILVAQGHQSKRILEKVGKEVVDTLKDVEL